MRSFVHTSAVYYCMYIYRVYIALILFYICIYIAHIYYFVLHLAIYIITVLKKNIILPFCLSVCSALLLH